MTVRELIALLSQQDPNTEIFREDHEWKVCEIRGRVEPGEYSDFFGAKKPRPRKGLVLK